VDELGATHLRWSVVWIYLPTTAGTISTALLVAIAFDLAVGRGREEPGALGRGVIAVVSVVGVVVAAIALLGVQQVVSRSPQPGLSSCIFGRADCRPAGSTGLTYVAAMSAFLPAAALAFGSAFMA